MVVLGSFLFFVLICLVKWEVNLLIEMGNEEEGDRGLKKSEEV